MHLKIMARRLTTGRGLKPTTAANYQRYVEQDITPSRLGEMRLTDIRRSHVNTWVAELTKADVARSRCGGRWRHCG